MEIGAENLIQTTSPLIPVVVGYHTHVGIQPDYNIYDYIEWPNFLIAGLWYTAYRFFTQGSRNRMKASTAASDSSNVFPHKPATPCPSPCAFP